MNQIKLSFLCAVLSLSNLYVLSATGSMAMIANNNGAIARCLAAAGQFFDAHAAAAALLTELQLLSAANDFVSQFAAKNWNTPLATASVTRDATVSAAITAFIATLS